MIWRDESQTSLPVIENYRELLHHIAAQDRFNRYGPFPVRSGHTETRVRRDSRRVYFHFYSAHAKNDWLGLFNLKVATQIFADRQLWRSQIHESQRLPLRPIRSHKSELNKDSVIIKNKRCRSGRYRIRLRHTHSRPYRRQKKEPNWCPHHPIGLDSHLRVLAIAQHRPQ